MNIEFKLRDSEFAQVKIVASWHLFIVLDIICDKGYFKVSGEPLRGFWR
jgi:hypothetical protein